MGKDLTIMPQPMKINDTTTKTNVQIFIPFSVSKFIVYNTDVMKIVQIYEMNYLRANYQSIITVATKGSYSSLMRFGRSLAKNLGIIGSVLAGFLGLYTLVAGRSMNSRFLLEGRKSDLSDVKLTSFEVSDTLTITTIPQIAIDEFTTSDKIFAYSIAENGHNLKIKESILATEYDRIIALETIKPVYVVTDYEYESQDMKSLEEKVDFVIVDFTNEVVELVVTGSSKVIRTQSKLSEILLTKTYQELDLQTLTSLLQKLTRELKQ